MDWKTLLAYITGPVDQELLMRNEYLVTENRILRHQLKGHIRLNDGERKALAEIGQKLGKQAIKEVANIVKPDTILGWHRTLVVQKCDGSKQRKAPGRPPMDKEVEDLTDFCTAEVWTLSGLVTYYGLFFIYLGSRKVHVAGVTPYPDERWFIRQNTLEQHLPIQE